VSDCFGAALWSLDYAFYAAQTNISRLYFHQGAGWKYSAWNPVAQFNISAGVKGPYYSWLLSATALSGGNKQVEMLVSNSTFTAYAIYVAAAGSADQKSKLESILLLNLNVWSATADPAQRPYVRVNLPKNLATSATRAKRLTAPGADTYSNVTWANQTISVGGHVKGNQVQEKVVNNTVLIGASEALLIKL
jgi:hypothetical protein